MNEEKWVDRMLSIAELVATWSSCCKRKVGCVITDWNYRIISTGYNGAPSGMLSCIEANTCLRYLAESGSNLEECRAVHAEQNAVAQATKHNANLESCYAFVTVMPCTMCIKLLIQCGIRKVYYVNEYNNQLTAELANAAGISLIKWR